MIFIKKLDSPWCASILIAFLYLLVLKMQLSAHNLDPSYFIDIGDRYVEETESIPRNLIIVPNSTGYDGQFYYQLALDPFSLQGVNSGLRVDNGPYRNQRIFYPLLAWLLAFGDRDFIPPMLLVVNYLGLCAIAWLGGRYAQLHQVHALWGSLFGLYSGFLFTLTHDLTEIIAATFLLAGILSLERSPSRIWPSIFLTLAILTRETSLLAVLALGVGLAWKREFSRWPVMVIPIIVYSIWQVSLWMKWGQLPAATARLLMDFPGIGILEFIKSLNLANPMHRVWLVELIYLAVIVLIAWVAFRTIVSSLSLKLIWLCYLMMALLLSSQIWIEDVAFMRAVFELYILSLVLAVSAARSRLLIPMAFGAVTTWILVLITRLNW